MKKRTTYLHAPRRKLQKGMTLVEVIVVITIIAIITTLVAVAVLPQLEDANQKAATIGVGNIMNALKLYYANKGSYPDAATGLKALVPKYLEEVPQDPWGKDYVYTLEGGQPVVISYGSDGQPGGEGAAEDISSKNLKKKKEN